MHMEQSQSRPRGRRRTKVAGAGIPAGEADVLAGLLAAVAGGDRARFRELYVLTSSRLLGIAVKMLGRRELAEEVLQEAFLAIWQKAGQYRADAGSPMGWLTTIVRHRAIDRHRAQNTSLENSPGDNDDIEALTDAASIGAEARIIAKQSILKCLQRLKDQQKDLILLAFYQGYSHDELAVRVGRPLGTVKSDVRRGLANLRFCLEN